MRSTNQCHNSSSSARATRGRPPPGRRRVESFKVRPSGAAPARRRRAISVRHARRICSRGGAGSPSSAYCSMKALSHPWRVPNSATKLLQNDSARWAKHACSLAENDRRRVSVAGPSSALRVAGASLLLAPPLFGRHGAVSTWQLASPPCDTPSWQLAPPPDRFAAADVLLRGHMLRMCADNAAAKSLGPAAIAYCTRRCRCGRGRHLGMQESELRNSRTRILPSAS